MTQPPSSLPAARPADSTRQGAPDAAGGYTTEAADTVGAGFGKHHVTYDYDDKGRGTRRCQDTCPVCAAEIALDLLAAAARRTEQAETERDAVRSEFGPYADRCAERDAALARVRDLEALRDKIGEFAMAHSALDGHGVVLAALYRIGEECEQDAALVSGAADGNSDE